MMRAIGGPGDVARSSPSTRTPTSAICCPRSACRPWSSIAAKTAICRSSTAGTWRNTSPAPSSSSYPEAHMPGTRTMPSPRRWAVPGDDPSGRGRPRPFPRHRVVHRHRRLDRGRGSVGDRAWAELVQHHRIVRGHLAGTEAPRWIPLATASSPRSTDRRERSAARLRSKPSFAACDRVSSGRAYRRDPDDRREDGGIAVSLALGSPRWRGRPRCWSPRRSRTSRWSGLMFEDAGEHELKGVPDRWHVYRVMA